MYITDARMIAFAQLHPGHLREPCLLEHGSQHELEGMKKHACGCAGGNLCWLHGVPVDSTCMHVLQSTSSTVFTVRYICAGVAKQDSLTSCALMQFIDAMTIGFTGE